MKNKILLILFPLFTAIGFSQDEKSSFTLQEAINYALENNRTAKNATLDVEAAKAQKKETIATGLPQINAAVNYQNAIKKNVFVFEDQIIETGSKHTLTGTATLTQLLFDGSYLVGLQSAKVFLEISKNAKDKTNLEVRKTVINAYGNILLAEENLKILKRNIVVLEKNLFDITKIYENGLEQEESVEQLKITLSGVKSNLNNVKRLRVLAYQMFNITIGKPINADTKLTEDLELLTAKNIVLTLLDADGDNVENTIDYKIASNDKTSKELLVKLEKSKALPQLNGFLNGGYIANRERFDFTNTNQRWFASSFFGLGLNVPIFSSGLRNAATQRAKINLEKAEQSLTETEQRLKLKIAAGKSDYQFAIDDYENKKENLNLAERIEKKNQIKFFEGIGSSFELRQAQTQLYQAQNELLQTMLDVINKKAELETVLNTLPEN